MHKLRIFALIFVVIASAGSAHAVGKENVSTPGTYRHNFVKNEITLLDPVPAGRYLPEEAVRSVLGDSLQASEAARWLKAALKLDSAAVESFTPYAVGEGLASEHYKLTLKNGHSYFIKVEASTLRIGKQRLADQSLRDMGLLKPIDGVEFVAQLASVLVKFDTRINEIIVFPLIDGERLDRAIEKRRIKPRHFGRLGHALARVKIESMKHNGTYQDFLDGRGLIDAAILPDFHHGNIILGANDTLHILDYQLLRFSQADGAFADLDVERILFDTEPAYENAFLVSYCLEFPIGIPVGNHCQRQ